MDFSAEFVAFRDRLLEGQDKAFVSRQNVQVAGRMAALLSSFGVDSERKFLGLMPLGNSSHAHEYRLLFAAPELDEQALEDWWVYACEDASHEFSIVSLILATGTVDKAVQKKLKKLTGGRDFSSMGRGWSSVRIAAVGLDEHKAYTNRMGDALKNILKPIL